MIIYAVISSWYPGLCAEKLYSHCHCYYLLLQFLIISTNVLGLGKFSVLPFIPLKLRPGQGRSGQNTEAHLTFCQPVLVGI